MVHLNHDLKGEIVCHQSQICSRNIDKNVITLSYDYHSIINQVDSQSTSKIQSLLGSKHHHKNSPIPNFSKKFSHPIFSVVKTNCLGGLFTPQTSCVHGDAMTLRNCETAKLQSLEQFTGDSMVKILPLRSLRYTWSPTSEFQKITSQDDTIRIYAARLATGVEECEVGGNHQSN